MLRNCLTENIVWSRMSWLSWLGFSQLVSTLLRAYLTVQHCKLVCKNQLTHLCSVQFMWTAKLRCQGDFSERWEKGMKMQPPCINFFWEFCLKKNQHLFVFLIRYGMQNANEVLLKLNWAYPQNWQNYPIAHHTDARVHQKTVHNQRVRCVVIQSLEDLLDFFLLAKWHCNSWK